MGKAYYDQQTDTLYAAHGDGSGWFAFFVVLSTPFFVVASLLEEYAQIINKHPLLSTVVYLLLVGTASWCLHRKKEIRNRKIGILAGMLTLLPVWLAQLMYAVPYILMHDHIFSVTMEWVLVTGISFGVSFLLLHIGIILRNGKKHLLLASIYVAIVWGVLMAV